ncbi:hypothetical protein L6164_023741 [Bauhinia variegata]|uniref:Uncharacterized protein n=1 Tax=Bauhinia variegata TaxID=167791 RepID=A0ACB9ML64_BAUVA|nr:hypothetical protein L6164_023741 [Bauhinia variegata]
MEDKVERIWITDIASDGIHLVGHTKGFIQVLVAAPDSMLGTSVLVKITPVGRWLVDAETSKNLVLRDMKAAAVRILLRKVNSPRESVKKVALMFRAVWSK